MDSNNKALEHRVIVLLYQLACFVTLVSAILFSTDSLAQRKHRIGFGLNLGLTVPSYSYTGALNYTPTTKMGLGYGLEFQYSLRLSRVFNLDSGLYINKKQYTLSLQRQSGTAYSVANNYYAIELPVGLRLKLSKRTQKHSVGLGAIYSKIMATTRSSLKGADIQVYASYLYQFGGNTRSPSYFIDFRISQSLQNLAVSTLETVKVTTGSATIGFQFGKGR